MTKDLNIAEKAEREVEAQLKIIRALKPLNRARRQKVIIALAHLLATEEQVPGILASITASRS